MSITTCTCCGSTLHWSWEEAFDKFGFNDGDGMVMTETVAHALRKAGYEVVVTPWALHNPVITSIRKDGASLIPPDTATGYTYPRLYLPKPVIHVLDAAFPEDEEVQP